MMVLVPNTISYPRTVVVHLQHTLPTDMAMVGTFWLGSVASSAEFGEFIGLLVWVGGVALEMENLGFSEVKLFTGRWGPWRYKNSTQVIVHDANRDVDGHDQMHDRAN